ncbi:hypothetical protein GDO81_017507 [Engystomops pustulosus]|uniref:Uncharacterized protein n=1 Tax=Engystomops pustulosus TaxID=76066 RepID=A0AAV7AEI7_ENGPU|nr:hypothetical protein GDO81_017507 [Engystomops pustulosus]
MTFFRTYLWQRGSGRRSLSDDRRGTQAVAGTSLSSPTVAHKSQGWNMWLRRSSWPDTKWPCSSAAQEERRPKLLMVALPGLQIRGLKGNHIHHT